MWKLSGVVSAATNIDQKEDVKSAIALKKALLLRPLYQIANMCGLSPIKDYIQMKAKNNLSIVATQSSQNGNWFDLQQCKMWAERFEIRFSDIYRGSLTPLNAHEGYKQLGYIIAEIMSIRDSLHNKKSIVLPEISEILEKLTIAYEVGSNPEVWKLSRAIQKKFDSVKLPCIFKQRSKDAWKACEYSLPMRIFLRLRKEHA